MATATMTAKQANEELRKSLMVKSPEESVPWINMLVYGEAGAGKTFLAGTADDDPRLSPVLIADVEGGLHTIRKRKSIDTKPIRSMKELEDLYNTLYRSVTDAKLYYQTVVIDSLTELADLDMRSIMKETYLRNPDRVDVDVPSPREWGKTRNHIRTIVRAFRDLPCHVVYTCHVGNRQEEGQPTRTYPGFAGKLAVEVPGFMDIVGYLYPDIQGEVITRKLQVQGTRRIVAKDRTDSLGGIVEDPTMTILWDLISNS